PFRFVCKSPILDNQFFVHLLKLLYSWTGNIITKVELALQVVNFVLE
ncbi:MAG: hypothetical protein ACI8RD_009380, partial [Bacillariaceae sp.]